MRFVENPRCNMYDSPHFNARTKVHGKLCGIGHYPNAGRDLGLEFGGIGLVREYARQLVPQRDFLQVEYMSNGVGWKPGEYQGHPDLRAGLRPGRGPWGELQPSDGL